MCEVTPAGRQWLRQSCSSLALLTVLCGCQTTSPAGRSAATFSGPIYRFESEPPPVQGVLPISFEDGRPAWERQYYPSASVPADYERGISFIAAENFHPAVPKELETRVRGKLATLESRPAYVTIELTSFRTVINRVALLYDQHLANEERERQKEKEEEEEERRDEEWRRSMGMEEDDDESIGSEILGGIFGALLSASFKGMTMAARQQMQGKVGPPEELPIDYPTGVTCELAGQAVLRWSSGRTCEIPFNVRTQSPAVFDNPRSLARDVLPTVNQALDLVAQQVLDVALQREAALK